MGGPGAGLNWLRVVCGGENAETTNWAKHCSLDLQLPFYLDNPISTHLLNWYFLRFSCCYDLGMVYLPKVHVSGFLHHVWCDRRLLPATLFELSSHQNSELNEPLLFCYSNTNWTKTYAMLIHVSEEVQLVGLVTLWTKLCHTYPLFQFIC